MKIVLTGASGFLGRRVSHFFEDNGYEIVRISRADFNGSNEHIAFKIEGAEAVIHLAGAPIFKRWTKAWKKEIIRSRVDTSKKLVEAINVVKNKPQVLISTSAVGIYDGIEIHDEFSDRLGNDFLAEVCRKWEKSVTGISGDAPKLVILRLGVVLDSEGGALKPMLNMFSHGLGAVVGKGDQSFPSIHISDFLSVLWYVLQNPDSSGVYNVVAPEIVSNRYFSEELAKACKKKLRFRIPKFILYLMYRGGADVLLKGQKVVPKRLLYLGFPFQFLTARAMIEDLVHKKKET